MPPKINFYCQSLYQWFAGLAAIVQQNFSFYILVFFFCFSVDAYLFTLRQEWTMLLFWFWGIACISLLIGTMACDAAGRYRRLTASALFELLLLVSFICYRRYNVPLNFPLLSFVFFVAACIFFAKIKYLKEPILFLMGLLWFVDAFSIFLYKTPMNSTMFAILLETNYWEIMEYLSIFFNGTLFLCIASVIAASLAVRRYVRLHERYKSAVTKFLLFLLPAGILLPFLPYISTNYTNNYKESIPVLRFSASALEAIERRNAYAEFIAQGSSIALSENNAKIKNIVIVLGESVNRNHMHMYGYPLPTTPHAEQLRETGDLTAFANVISPHTATALVMTKLFTFYNLEFAEQPAYLQQNLIDIMKKAGYKTFWLSNQEFSSMFGNIEMHLSKRSDVKQFTRYRGAEQTSLAAYDEELLPLLDESLQDSADKKCIVLHLMGSHQSYAHRYPETYQNFNADDIQQERSSGKKRVIAAYDNSILYTDALLGEIYRRFAQQNALIFYLSDHGEDVFDTSAIDEITRSGTILTRHMAEVPFFILTTPAFRQQAPQQTQNIRSASNRPYMTDDFIHTVLDLAEIKTAAFDPTKSIVNPQFNAARKRVVNEKDYDAELLQKDAQTP